MSDTPILKLDRISVSYGKVEAVSDVSIMVPRGSVVTVIGANGAGKSSLLNAAMGLVASTGSIAVDGEEMRHRQTEARLARGLALVPEKRELFGTMSVADNLALGGYLRPRRRSRARLPRSTTGFPGLPNAAARSPARSRAANGRCWLLRAR